MKFKIKVNSPPYEIKHHASASADRILFKNEKRRQEQLAEAVEYCLEHNCKGYAAIKSGRFPSIKDPRTINRRLPVRDGEKRSKPKILAGEEKAYCKILTSEEESSFVTYLKNKNR